MLLSLSRLSLWLLCLPLIGTTDAQQYCSKVTFHVRATAENMMFVDLPEVTNSTAIAEYLANGFSNGPPTNGTLIISGEFEIGGTYCQPASSEADTGILQYFIHGATYNQTMWTGLGIDNEYNWVLFATNHGYHTLTLDSLGHGDNHARPDPYLVVQNALQAEINHNIISAIRNSSMTNPLNRTFDNIVLVTHSYGSSTGVSLVRSHPTDIDAFVITGWSTSLSRNAAVRQQFIPAVDVHPNRFAGLDKGYVTHMTEMSRKITFYAGNFNLIVPLEDYVVGDTVGVGEILSLVGGLAPARGFEGPILAVNGEMDVLLCNLEFGSCNKILTATRSLFPCSKHYETYAVPQTGHDLTLHVSAPYTLRTIHQWLAKHLQIQ